MNWRAHAACHGHDPELWFAKPYTHQAVKARKICGQCRVQDQCLTDILAHEAGTETRLRYGIYAGLHGEQRERIHQRRTA